MQSFLIWLYGDAYLLSDIYKPLYFKRGYIWGLSNTGFLDPHLHDAFLPHLTDTILMSLKSARCGRTAMSAHTLCLWRYLTLCHLWNTQNLSHHNILILTLLFISISQFFSISCLVEILQRKVVDGFRFCSRHNYFCMLMKGVEFGDGKTNSSVNYGKSILDLWLA